MKLQELIRGHLETCYYHYVLSYDSGIYDGSFLDYYNDYMSIDIDIDEYSTICREFCNE